MCASEQSSQLLCAGQDPDILLVTLLASTLTLIMRVTLYTHRLSEAYFQPLRYGQIPKVSLFQSIADFS
jgi:hypothetical protein